MLGQIRIFGASFHIVGGKRGCPQCLSGSRLQQKHASSFCLFWLRLLSAFFCTSPLALANDLPEFSEIKTAVEAASNARLELLNNSSGIALLRIARKAKPGKEAELDQTRRDFSKERGLDLDKIRFRGSGECTTKWYNKGSTKRYDVTISEVSTPERPQKYNAPRRPLLPPTIKRVAVDEEKSIVYSVLANQVYINKPFKKVINPFYLIKYFDIKRFYDRVTMGSDILSFFGAAEKKGLQPHITKDTLGNDECLKLEFTREKDAPGGNLRRVVTRLWLSPKMSYSVLKAQLFSNRETGYKELKLIEEYRTTYEESKEHKGIWLLKDVRIYAGQGIMEETFTCEFKETKVGVEIPDELFTLAGLGVPLGTRISDRTLGGEALKYYYGVFPAGEIDDFLEGAKHDFGRSENMKQRGLFVPNLRKALLKGTPYMLDMESQELIYSRAEINTPEGHKSLLKNGRGDMCWDRRFIAVRGAALISIMPKTQKQLLATEEKWTTSYELAEDVKLPYLILCEPMEEASFLLILDRIEENGIWVNCRKLNRDERLWYMEEERN